MQPMRPRFREVLGAPPEAVVGQLRACEGGADRPCRLTVLGHHVEVTIVDAHRHAWSPQLTLEVVEHAEGTELFGHFGPNPAIWTTFLACYGFVGLCMFFGGLFGISQLAASQRAWGLWVLPAGALLCCLIYCASLWGQRLASAQMSQLAEFLHAALAIDSSAPGGTESRG